MIRVSATRREKTYYAALCLYVTYAVGAFAYMVTRSPALISILGEQWYSLWTFLFLAGSLTLLIGLLFENPYIEVVGTLPTAAAASVYALSLIIGEPPYGEVALGVGASAWIGASVWWLVIRFLFIYPNLGKPSVRD